MSFDGMGRREFTIDSYRFVHHLSSFQDSPNRDDIWIIYPPGTSDPKTIFTFESLEQASWEDGEEVLVKNKDSELTLPKSLLYEFVDKAYYLYQYEYTETLLLRVNRKLQNNELSTRGLSDLADCLKNLFNDLET